MAPPARADDPYCLEDAVGPPAVIVSSPSVDGVACAVIAARAAGGPAVTLFWESERLLDFFGAPVQQKLPGVYSLVICDHTVVHTNWDGELVRPRLMDALRASVAPMLWFSAQRWQPEDRAAVQNILGAERLVVSEAASCTAELVHGFFAGQADQYTDTMVLFASGRLPQEAAERWGNEWRRVISALKADPTRLSEAVGPLIEGTPERLGENLRAQARRIEAQNRDAAARSAAGPLPVGEHKLVVVVIPRERHAFWCEIGEFARAHKGAELCLCHLEGRCVLILSRGPDTRVDLRIWARYLTDLMPRAHAVGERPEAVPVFVEGLREDAGLRDEAVRILQEGAHLLADRPGPA